MRNCYLAVDENGLNSLWKQRLDMYRLWEQLGLTFMINIMSNTHCQRRCARRRRWGVLNSQLTRDDCRRVRSHCWHDANRLSCWQICSDLSRLSPTSCKFHTHHRCDELSRVGWGVLDLVVTVKSLVRLLVLDSGHPVCTASDFRRSSFAAASRPNVHYVSIICLPIIDAVGNWCIWNCWNMNVTVQHNFYFSS